MGQSRKQISLAEIVLSKRVRARAGGLSQEHVADLAEAYKAHAEIDAPRVWRIKGKPGFWVTRGWHRVAALKKLGRTQVECELKDGTFDEALLDAVGDNLGHGLRRTNKDKRRCVKLLRKQFPDWSDRKIADAAGVHHDLVGDVRNGVADSATGGEKGREKPSNPKHAALVALVKKAPNKEGVQDWIEAVVKAVDEVAAEIRGSP
jgi:ParB-like chromosome segregation protein Spo0J